MCLCCSVMLPACCVFVQSKLCKKPSYGEVTDSEVHYSFFSTACLGHAEPNLPQSETRLPLELYFDSVVGAQ